MSVEQKTDQDVQDFINAGSTATLKQIVEALIFASDKPISLQHIKTLLGDHGSAEAQAYHASVVAIKETIDDLNKEYEQAQSAYRIIEIAGGYQFATVPTYAKWVGKLFQEKRRRRLSQAALETLSIIAYRQPISKPEMEYIRGVNVDYVIKSLLERELITMVGRGEGVGRPLLFGTTQKFLKRLGLKSLSDLPKPREIEEIMKDEESAQPVEIAAGEPAQIELAIQDEIESAAEEAHSETSSPAVQRTSDETEQHQP